MTPERWQQIKAVLAAALERTPVERAAFLEEACGGDISLRAEVESLIACEQPGDSVIDSPSLERRGRASVLSALLSRQFETTSLAGVQPAAEAEWRIGPYRVVRELARGGMGAVYLAERADEQYRREVAIKLIRRGMDTEFVLRRFRNERQILAALDHTNIARLLDGGTTPDRSPYLVMEYVEGVPVDVYCDRHTLSTEERLKLFRQVCSAVGYAHQYLVIHRDIKPSNILVTEEGVPKLLDFGIAKLLGPELAAQTIDPTASALRLMTPAYASPEQIKGEPITTATDVYSLGVLLYELLTGHRPYRVKRAASHELMQAVLGEEPIRPSTVVALTEEVQSSEGSTRVTITPESVSSARGGNPVRLRRRLRGDLDNIVLMALRKDPQRRYPSVQQFSEDIRRHLEGRPVTARSDTLSYRAAKFVRRNRIGVAAAAMVLLTLVGGILGVNQQRRRAERRFNDVRKLAHSVVFDYHDAIADLPGATPVRERLVKDALEYLDSLASEAGDDLTLQRELAAAYGKIGDVQGNSNVPNLGDTTGALDSYRKSLAIRQALVRDDPENSVLRAELVESYERIGDVLRTMGEVREADKNYREAISLLEKNSASAPDDRQQQRRLAGLLYRVGNLKGYARTSNSGDTKGALEYHRRALALREALCAADPSDASLRLDLQESHRSIANILGGASNELTEGESHARQAVTIAQGLADADRTNARALRALIEAQDSLARLLMKKGELVQAADVCRQSLETAQAMLDADPTNMQARQDLESGHALAGNIYLRKGDAALAKSAGNGSTPTRAAGR
jgi:non-specific serine/threonine protein kinase/serine/threonine-protein kinase